MLGVVIIKFLALLYLLKISSWERHLLCSKAMVSLILIILCRSVPADLSAPTSSSGVAVQQLGDREERGSGGEREEATSSQGDGI